MRTLLTTMAMLGLAACGDHLEPGRGAAPPAPSPTVGLACTADPGPCGVKCLGPNNTIGDRFPGGFCSQPCSTQEMCPEGTVCADRDGNRDPNDMYCLYPCINADDCSSLLQRPGYNCLGRYDVVANLFWVCVGR